MNILLIITGSISAYKSVSLANMIRQNGDNVKVVLTKSALQFIPKLSFSSQGIETYIDEDEWNNPNNVLHIELSQWCDICLIAPLTANTLGKIVNGIADNLATCCLIALNKNKQIIIAPAMNTNMYENVVVQNNFKKIIEYFPTIKIVEPATKLLACGVEGKGALANLSDILNTIGTKK